jgi:quinol-cytochrome oxidoreductase complex cytochrome b subunit
LTASDWKPKVFDWFDERLGLRMARDILDHKVVPLHSRTAWYYFGGMTLFLLGVQLFTGLLLLLYYRPTVAEAFDSVRFIMTQVEFGWLIRSIHSWSANLLIFVAFIHMFSVTFTHAYRPPRELTWLSGIVLLGLMLGFGFSGYLLPWNQISYFATKVGTDVAASVPVAGPFIGRFLRGGEDVGAATLTRFFAFHVMILPLITASLVGLHLLLVQKSGMSTPEGFKGSHDSHMKFFPNFLLRELMVWYGLLAVLGTLAAIFPWELGQKADPFSSAPAGIRPEWYFLAQFYTLKLLPSHVWLFEGEMLGLFGFGLLAVAWVALPFWSTRRTGEHRARLVTGAGVFLVCYLAVFTVLGYVK